MGTGDLAYAILENTKETAINVEDADAQPYVLYARWMKDGNKYYYRPEIVKNGDNYTFKNTASFYGLEKSSNTGYLLLRSIMTRTVQERIHFMVGEMYL